MKGFFDILLRKEMAFWKRFLYQGSEVQNKVTLAQSNPNTEDESDDGHICTMYQIRRSMHCYYVDKEEYMETCLPTPV